jgi:type IV pilus assembly protein PilN
MANINLLPWREAERSRRQREFGFMLAGGLVLALAVAFYMHIHVEGLIDHQNSRNAYLEGEIAALNRKIKEIRDLEKTKANLIARMDIIQRLQESRPEIVHLFDELVDTLPEGVYLTQVKQQERNLDLNGLAQSNARVSAYMRNIDASAWIGRSKLQVISQGGQKGGSMSNFHLKAQQITQQKKDS